MEYLYEEEVEAGVRSALGPLCLPRHAGPAADHVLPSMRRAFRAVTEPKDLENVGLREFRQVLFSTPPLQPLRSLLLVLTATL